MTRLMDNRMLRTALVAGWLLPALAAQPQDIPDGGDVAESVAAVDFNRDGLSDIAVAYAFSETLVTYRQQPDGAFTQAQVLDVGIYPTMYMNLPRKVLAGDINRDGFQDLVVLSSGNPNFFTRASIQAFLGSPSGTFRPRPAQPAEPNSGTPRGPVSMAIGDVNGDGLPDIVVAYRSANSFAVLRQVADGVFQLQPEVVFDAGACNGSAQALALADMTGDGILDLALGSTGRVCLLQGAPNGSFFPSTFRTVAASSALSALALADLDHNGIVDIAVAERDNPGVHILWDTRPGAPASSRPNTIVRTPSMNSLADLLVGNWTGSASQELLAVDNGASRVHVISPAGTVLEQIPTALAPRRGLLVDINGDSVPDLLTANEGDDPDLPGSNPANPDVTIARNTSAPANSLGLVPVGSLQISQLFPDNVGPIVSASVRKEDRYWVADGGRGLLLEFDPNSSSSQPRESIDLVALGQGPHLDLRDVSGFAFRNEDDQSLFLTTLDSHQVYFFHDGRLERTITPEVPPDGPLRGLAWNPDDETLLAIVQGEGGHTGTELWSMDDEGHLVDMMEIGSGGHGGGSYARYNQVAYDRTTDRYFLAVAGMPTIDVFERDSGGPAGDVLVPAGMPIDLRTLCGSNAPETIAGLGFDAGRHQLVVYTGAGRMMTIASSPRSYSRLATRTYRHGQEISGLTLDSHHHVLYGLCSSQAPEAVVFPLDGSPASAFSLEAAFSAAPDFYPGALAFDSANDTLVVLDRNHARSVRFSRNGSFLSGSLASLEATPGGTLCQAPFSGLEIDADTGRWNLRAQNGLVRCTSAGQAAERFDLDAGDPGDISLSTGSVYHLSPGRQQIQKLLVPSGTTTGTTFVRGRQNLGTVASNGLAEDESSQLIYVSTPSSDAVSILTRQGAASVSSSWAQYE